MNRKTGTTLADESSNHTDVASSCGATVENFASRIRRKLKEQEVQQSESNRLASERRKLILTAMTSVRKSLQEASKISLGERFHFSLDISDWEGWPKLELCLIDSLAPEISSLALIVCANDRNDLGIVQLQLRSGAVLGRVQLKDPKEFNRLPLLLKKCLRQFLDTVAAHVLNPSQVEEGIETKTIPLEVELAEQEAVDLSNEDLFTDDSRHDANENRAEIVRDEVEAVLAIPLAIKSRA